MLRFIIRMTADFTSTDAIKSLYFAHVFSSLNFVSIIWNTAYTVHTGKLEIVQWKMLKYLSFKTSIPFTNYNASCKYFYMLPLKEHRQLTDMNWLYKKTNNAVSSNVLVGLIGLHVPTHNTRGNELLYQVCIC